MTTLADLVNEVSLNLHGFSDDQEPRTHLTGDITTASTSFSVADASSISTGIIEIGDELVWVTTADSTNGLVTSAPYGRGFSGSTAASHTTGSMVVTSPRWPRFSIKRNINHVLGQVYPDLFQVKTTTLTANGAQVAYALPADVDSILSISWSAPGPSQEWVPIDRWRLNKAENTTAFPTGRSISIFNSVTPGRSINVVYVAAPSLMTADTDVFGTVTGLPESCTDVIVYGTTARLIQQYEASRLQLTTVSETDRAQYIQAGAATSASRAIYALYQQRLAEERAGLQRLYPTKPHYTR
jgi:hypothetical protein